MENQEPDTKAWLTPTVVVLDIKRDTKGGARPGNERNDTSKHGPPGLES